MEAVHSSTKERGVRQMDSASPISEDQTKIVDVIQDSTMTPTLDTLSETSRANSR